MSGEKKKIGPAESAGFALGFMGVGSMMVVFGEGWLDWVGGLAAAVGFIAACSEFGRSLDRKRDR